MKKFLMLGFVIAGCLAMAAPAVAGNWQDTRLDSAASQVAGHPVQVWCESTWTDWIHEGDYLREDFGLVRGVTWISYPTVYINPTECETLHALLGGEHIDTYHASLAIQVLAHESVHQRGISDEGVTDCTALPLVPQLAIDYFGIPTTVTDTYLKTVRKKVTVRAKGRTYVRYVTVQRQATRLVANPYLTGLAQDALRWHRTLPAEYQGNC
jgi:hypothetical protein